MPGLSPLLDPDGTAPAWNAMGNLKFGPEEAFTVDHGRFSPRIDQDDPLTTMRSGIFNASPQHRHLPLSVASPVGT